MKEFIIINVLTVLILIVMIVMVFGVDKMTCLEKYQAFNVKWNFSSGCQIEVKDKWIPAESYYFKEE